MRVGTAIADLTICGAVPPYNEVLGGKLLAMLMMSPEVVAEYRRRDAGMPSVIASSKAGRLARPFRVFHSPWPTNSVRMNAMKPLTRITFDPRVMGGKPCIRGMRVTVGTLVGLVASGHDIPEILAAYPYLEAADVREALAYAAWRAEELEAPLAQP